MQQYPDAMYALGTWYLHGKGDLVKLDLTRAIELIRAAAEAGNIEAMYDLAVSYDKGAGNSATWNAHSNGFYAPPSGVTLMRPSA
jgi:TPR repeat protein